MSHKEGFEAKHKSSENAINAALARARGEAVRLTPNQEEVLLNLEAERFLMPMEFGGYNGSHHSQTAIALSRKGLVQRVLRGHTRDPRALAGENLEAKRRIEPKIYVGEPDKYWTPKGSYVYRLTPKGREIAEEIRERRRLERLAKKKHAAT